MGYQHALEAAGAIIHDFIESGNYRGTWYALVTYEGNTGLVEGSYGSCNGCDAFQSEFDYYNSPEITKDRLADFGRTYLNHIINFDDAINDVIKYSGWDMNADRLLEWLRANEKLIHSNKFNKNIKEEINDL